jgi:hypothetical protein
VIKALTPEPGEEGGRAEALVHALRGEEVGDVLAVAVQELKTVRMVRLDSLADVNVPAADLTNQFRQ